MFVGESGSGHSVVMDGAPDAGGRNLGFRPMEMLLLGLGGLLGFRRGADPQARTRERDGLRRRSRRRSRHDRSESIHEGRMHYIVTGQRSGSARKSSARSAVGGKILLGASAMFGKTATMSIERRSRRYDRDVLVGVVDTATHLVNLTQFPRATRHETHSIRRLERRPEGRQGHRSPPKAACSSGTQYSFSTRFEDGKGTNPEELIAAAHAGCFTMALSAQLGNGQDPESIETEAAVTLERPTPASPSPPCI